jgi:hypothetical protein
MMDQFSSYQIPPTIPSTIPSTTATMHTRSEKSGSFKNAMLKAPKDTGQPNQTESSQIEKAYFESLLQASSNKNPKRMPDNMKPKS